MKRSTHETSELFFKKKTFNKMQSSRVQKLCFNDTKTNVFFLRSTPKTKKLFFRVKQSSKQMFLHAILILTIVFVDQVLCRVQDLQQNVVSCFQYKRQ